MARDTPTQPGGMRRFDELVAMRNVFGNDEVLLEEVVRNMSNRDANIVFRRVAKSFDVTNALNRELLAINQVLQYWLGGQYQVIFIIATNPPLISGKVYETIQATSGLLRTGSNATFASSSIDIKATVAKGGVITGGRFQAFCQLSKTLVVQTRVT